MLINVDIVNSIKSNIFHRSQAAIKDYYNFDWHTDAKGIPDTDKVNSSQALAIDFWGCLINSPEKDSIINHLFRKNSINWDIRFEYTDKSLLNEPRPTQVDVIIECSTYTIIIESKFTEKDGGGCSQILNKKLKSESHPQCNGNYEEQINPINNIKSKCALTGKGIKYWEYINTLTTYQSENDYCPCPFKKGEYQWMRNICFAEAYSRKYNKHAESYLTYYDSAKCPISLKVKNNTYLGNLKGKILNPDTFQPISYNDLLVNIIAFLNNSDSERQVWINLQNWLIKKEVRL